MYANSPSSLGSPCKLSGDLPHDADHESENNWVDTDVEQSDLDDHEL